MFRTLLGHNNTFVMIYLKICTNILLRVVCVLKLVRYLLNWTTTKMSHLLALIYFSETAIIILYYLYKTYQKICSLKLVTNDQIPGASSWTMIRITMKRSEMAQLVERKTGY